jgi:alanine racemase
MKMTPISEKTRLLAIKSIQQAMRIDQASYDRRVEMLSEKAPGELSVENTDEVPLEVVVKSPEQIAKIEESMKLLQSYIVEYEEALKELGSL